MIGCRQDRHLVRPFEPHLEEAANRESAPLLMRTLEIMCAVDDMARTVAPKNVK